jgi:alkylhydroperoxidase family enzyme
VTRIRLVDEESATSAEREGFAELRKRRPSAALVHRAILNSPAVIGPFLALADALRNETKLDPKLRELAILTALHTLRSRYEFLGHWMLALHVGVDEAKLVALPDSQAGGFSDVELAVIQLAREVTGRVAAAEATWSRAQALLSDQELVEVLLNVGLYNLTARLTEPIELEADPAFQPSAKAVATFENSWVDE